MLGDLSRLTSRPMFGLVLLIIVLLLAAAIFMAYYKGRGSRSFHAVSAVVSPVAAPLTRVLQRDDAAELTPPYSNAALQLDQTWRWRGAERVVVDTTRRDALVMQADAESLWFLNERGPFTFRMLDGDATITTSVQIRKRSDPTQTPDMEWQFAGLLMRDPAGDAWMSRENYVFNVIGFCCGELQIETKSTRDGASSIESKHWDGGDAELSIQRTGARFVLKARYGPTDEWRQITAFDRPDLPQRLQVGLIIYAHSGGARRYDMQATFRNFAVAR